MHLRQSTASQSVIIGPFVDSTDGVTAETGLTISNTDIRLSKNGANIAAKNSGGGTHDENGYYTITLDATDTDTVGRLQLHVNETGALPVYHEYEVLEEVVYDALYASDATILTAKDVGLLYESTVSTVNSQTSFDMADTINTDDNWIGNEAVIEDVTNNDSVTVRITDVDQANDRLIIASGDTTFTVATSDIIRVFSRKHPLASLQDYDGPTRTEATNDANSILDRVIAAAQLILRSDAAIAADRSTELDLINADEGAGAGTYDNQTDSLQQNADSGVNVTQVNGEDITGTGEPGNLWRRA